jgi:hypothetical protein
LCALACWTLLLNIGNPTGLVLCIEADGTTNIETLAEQAVCHDRQTQAATSADWPRSCIAKSAGCVDIPLSTAPAAGVHRTPMPRAIANSQDTQPAANCVVVAEHSNSQSIGCSVFHHGHSGLSPTLAARRTVVLLI